MVIEGLDEELDDGSVVGPPEHPVVQLPSKQ